MNVIVDTSVWIDHLKKSVEELSVLLEEGKVLSHSWVIGELATGQMRNRNAVLGNMKLLPQAKEATLEELLDLVEEEKLYGRGLSLTDVQILASALLSEAKILTRDRAMLLVSKELGVKN